MRQMSLLLEGPMPPFVGEAAEEVPRLDEPDLDGFRAPPGLARPRLPQVDPDRVRAGASGSLVYGYRRLKILRQPENTGNTLFRMRRCRPAPWRRCGSRPSS